MTRVTREQVEAAMRGQVDEVDDDQEPDADPFEERLAQLEEKYTEPAQRAEMLRLRVCRRLGLDPRFAGRLAGDNEAEVEADAREFLEAFPGRQVKRRPTEQLRGGLGADVPAKLDPRALAALVHRSPWD